MVFTTNGGLEIHNIKSYSKIYTSCGKRHLINRAGINKKKKNVIVIIIIIDVVDDNYGGTTTTGPINSPRASVTSSVPSSPSSSSL